MQTATGIQLDANLMIGISDGTSHKCAAMSDDDSQATTVSSSTLNSTNCIVILQNGSTTIDSAGDIDSFDSDGFTVGWNSASATQFVINYFAFGGSDITNVKVVKHDVVANSQYTQVGFQPDFVFLLWGRPGEAEASSAGTGCAVGWGAATSSTEQGYCYGVVEPAQATSDTYHKNSTSQPINIMSLTGGTLDYTPGAFSAFTSTGFNITTGANNNTSTDFFSLSVAGGVWDVGAFSQKTSTGTQNVTVDTGLDPGVILLGSCNDTTADSATGVMGTQCRLSFGATDGTNERAIFAGSTDAQATAEIAKSNYDNASAFMLMTESAAGGTVNAQCNFTAHQDGLFTLNWTTADATARLCFFIALEAVTAPTSFTVSQTSIHKYAIAKDIVQTSIQKYNIAKYILQTAIQKYDLRKFLAQVSIQKYGLRKNLAQTTIHKYGMGGTVLRTVIHKYSISKYLAQSTIQKYAILKLVTLANIQKYALRKNIVQASIQKYSRGGVVLRTVIQKYNISKTLAQTNIQKYAIRKTVAATASIHKYVLRANVVRTSIHKYNTVKRILQTSVHKYNLGAALPVAMILFSAKWLANKFITKL